MFQSISGRLPERGRKKRESIDERKNVQTTPPEPTASTIGPCPTVIQVSRTPRHWKFTQHLRTTLPPLFPIVKMTENHRGVLIHVKSFPACDISWTSFIWHRLSFNFFQKIEYSGNYTSINLIARSIPRFSGLSDENLNRGPVSV